MVAFTDFGNSFFYWNWFENVLQEKHSFASEIFREQAERLCGFTEARLDDRDYFTGEYSIANIGAFPFIGGPRCNAELLAKHPNLSGWADRIEAREAVQRGLKVPVLPTQ